MINKLVLKEINDVPCLANLKLKYTIMNKNRLRGLAVLFISTEFLVAASSEGEEGPKGRKDLPVMQTSQSIFLMDLTFHQVY